MNYVDRAELEQMGLSAAEACIYLTLLRRGPLGASAIAAASRIPRTSVYPVLCSMVDKGMVESGAGYGSRFSAIAPADALPSLVLREREALVQREHIAGQLVERLSALAEPAQTLPQELIQVIRNTRVLTDRFHRLQLETEREVQAFVKSPILCVTSPDNPAQKKAQRHGVRYRVIYERAATEDPLIKPRLAGWIADGEEAHVYEGELPHKLQIFDQEIVLMPLMMPGDQTQTLLIRHKQLATSLSMLFEFLWKQTEPLASPAEIRKKSIKSPGKPAGQSHTAVLGASRNGRRKRPERT